MKYFQRLGTKAGVIGIVLMVLLTMGVVAQIYEFFAQQDAEVTIEGIELFYDGELAQNLIVTDYVDVAAGHSTLVNHTLFYDSCNGPTMDITFGIMNELEEGLSVTFLDSSQNNTITGLTLTQGVEETFYIKYTADPRMSSGTFDANIVVNVTSC